MGLFCAILKDMRILFIGGPGTGKSTVGSRLAKDLGWSWISSGAILRESKEQWVIDRLKTAQLFDDVMISDLVFSRLDGIQNAIIDGYPRTLKQAEMIIERGLNIDYIVELLVPFEEVMKRLSMRGRSQDTPEIIEERQMDYEHSRNEIVAYLVGNGVKLLTVDGMGEVDEVYKRAVLTIRNEINEENKKHLV